MRKERYAHCNHLPKGGSSMKCSSRYAAFSHDTVHEFHIIGENKTLSAKRPIRETQDRQHQERRHPRAGCPLNQSFLRSPLHPCCTRRSCRSCDPHLLPRQPCPHPRFALQAFSFQPFFPPLVHLHLQEVA